MTKKTDHTLVFIYMIVLSTITYYYALDAMPGVLCDYHGHLYVYLPKFLQDNWLEGWQTVPYCMWHVSVIFLNKVLFIPLEVSAACISCLFTSLSYLVTYWMIRKVTSAIGYIETSGKAAFIAFALSMVQSFYLPWLDGGDRFMGVYSINPIHNPTQMCVKVFSLLCFCLVHDIWGIQENREYKGIFFKVETNIKKYYILLAVFLFLSTLAKPTFAEMFIPAVGILMLWKLLSGLIRKEEGAKPYFKHCLHMFLCALPALFYIGLQFFDYYIFGGNNNAETSVIISNWLEVWELFSANIFLSVLLSMAFPIFVILIDTRFFFTSNMGKLSLAGYAVAFLEAALLAEGGEKFSHGNFLWPLMSAMLLVWIVSIFRLLILEKTGVKTKIQSILVDCAWILFYIHVAFGFMYHLAFINIK